MPLGELNQCCETRVRQTELLSYLVGCSTDRSPGSCDPSRRMAARQRPRAAPSHIGGSSMLCRRPLMLGLLAMLLSLVLMSSATASADVGPKVVTVQCDKHKTIGDALSEHKGPITIQVVG